MSQKPTNYDEQLSKPSPAFIRGLDGGIADTRESIASLESQLRREKMHLTTLERAQTQQQPITSEA
jgi:hypothetical protein